MIQCIIDGRIATKNFKIVNGEVIREDDCAYGHASINFEQKPDACPHDFVFVGDYFNYGWYECSICGKKKR